jgi:hypothetical protein
MCRANIRRSRGDSTNSILDNAFVPGVQAARSGNPVKTRFDHAQQRVRIDLAQLEYDQRGGLRRIVDGCISQISGTPQTAPAN